MNTYQCEQEGCEIIVPSEEYGSYCPEHRLDVAGCCLNHCTLSEEGSHCTMHCRDSIIRKINEAFENAKQRAFELNCYDTYYELQELEDDFNTLGNPVIWTKKLIHLLTGWLIDSSILEYASNQISFIRIIRNTLIRNDMFTDEIVRKIYSFAHHRLEHYFVDIINAIFAEIDEENYNSEIVFDDSDDEFEFEIFHEILESTTSNINAINDFNETYQLLAPSMEKINEDLKNNNIKLCPECLIPQSHGRLCSTCTEILGIVNPLM